MYAESTLTDTIVYKLITVISLCITCSWNSIFLHDYYCYTKRGTSVLKELVSYPFAYFQYKIYMFKPFSIQLFPVGKKKKKKKKTKKKKKKKKKIILISEKSVL